MDTSTLRIGRSSPDADLGHDRFQRRVGFVGLHQVDHLRHDDRRVAERDCRYLDIGSRLLQPVGAPARIAIERAPACAKAMAMALPMPVPPPVMTTFFLPLPLRLQAAMAR